MDLGLKGKRAIVTGATRGIGRRIVDLLADEGVHIGLCARDAGEVDAAVAALKAKGVNAVGGVVNIRKGDEYTNWLKQSSGELGACVIFVPYVSAGGGDGGEERWDK